MARANERQVRRPEDWFPPARPTGVPTETDVDAAIAAALANYYTEAEANALLAAKRNVGTIDATLQANTFLVKADASAGNVTVNLPAAAGAANRIINIKKMDATANTVTVDGNGAETIDSGATAVLTVQWECITVISDGTQWLII